MNIVFLRHGEAEGRKDTGDFVKDDLERRLTQRGREQVLTDLGRFDLVVSSPAERAKETARIAGRMNPIIINSLSTHLWDGDWESVDSCFVNRGNISLHEMYDEINGIQLAAVKKIKEEAMRETEELVKKIGKDEPRVLVAGHAMFLPALAEAFALKDGNSRDKINNLVLGEGESFSYFSSPR
ncbi:hypothetical protein MNBD_BACTEROID05-75 [hydrothermal vent metagenome]|uniref:Phosphoglycerate mutase family protein n=1 Tax=hydrothermal vent metagenome TaxID=652676 RepID=A0A3B0TFX3_9ZZZZ